LPSAGLVMPSDHLPQSYTPLQSITGRACRTRQPTGPTALMGFGPLRRLRQSGAHHPRACLTRFVALTGFLSLLALCFSRRLPALFHAGNALGVPPSRAFPPRQAGDTFSGPLALLPLAAAYGSTSGPWGQARIRCCGAPCFRPRRNPLLSWAFIPSRVFPSPAMGPQRVPPLLTLSATDSQFRLRMASRVLLGGGVGLTLSSLPTLLGSPASSSFRPTRKIFGTQVPTPLHPDMKCRSVLRWCFRSTERSGRRTFRRRTRATRTAFHSSQFHIA
jgi:hypothetical protein